jgi:hypothetical protein
MSTNRALILLLNNINIKAKEFCEITGFSEQYFYRLRKKAEAILNKKLDSELNYKIDETFGLKTELAYKLKAEMLQKMQEKYGFANLKQTPFERI